MTAVSWVGASSGKWRTAKAWSTGKVPGAKSDVTISTDSAITVTYATGSSSIDSLTTGSNDVFAVTGGTLAVTGWLDLVDGLVQTGGTLDLSGGPDTITDLQQKAGTLVANGSSLSLNGTGTIGGAITGAWVDIDGNYTLASAAALSTAEVTVGEFSDLTVSANTTITGQLQADDPTLILDGKRLVLSGQDVVDGGSISGTGTLVNQGALSIGQSPDVFGSPAMSGVVTLENTGLLSTSGAFAIGAVSSDRAALVNAASGTWTLLESGAITGETIENAGTLVKAGNDSASITVDSFTSTGTILVAGGSLALSDISTNFTLGGSIQGAGTLVLSQGVFDLSAKASLKVASIAIPGGYEGTSFFGAELVLGANLAYGGAWNSGGLIYLNGSTLTLSGSDVFGGSSFFGFGAQPLAYFEGSGEVLTKGVVNVTSGIYDANANIVNAATGTMTLSNAASISGTLDSRFQNAGLLADAGSAAIALATFTNTGTINIGTGTLTFGYGGTATLGGTIQGSGELDLVDNTTIFEKALALSAGTLAIDGGTLTLGADFTEANRFIFSDDGTIALAGDTLTLKGPASLAGGTFLGNGAVNLLGTTSITGTVSGDAVIVNKGTINGDGGVIDTTSFNNSGTLSLGSSGLAIGDFTSIGTATLGGTIDGAGTLALIGGTTSLAAKIMLATGGLAQGGGTLTLGASLTYDGTTTLNGGTLDLAAKQILTLSGAASINDILTGAGTLSLTGQSSINNLSEAGTVTVTNAGTATVSSISDFQAPNDAQLLVNQAGAVMEITPGAHIQLGGALQNAGTLVVEPGSGGFGTSISAALVNTGTLSVLGSSLSILGSLTGAGLVSIGAYATLSLEAGASGGTVAFGTHSALDISDFGGTFTDVLSGFAAGNIVQLSNEQYQSDDSFTYHAATGLLTLSTGEILQFASGLSASDFKLVDSNSSLAIAHS